MQHQLFTARCTTAQSAALLLQCHVVRPSVCLSVCPSVTLVDQDHIGWKSWKLTARTISPTPSLFVAQRPSTYFHGKKGKFWGDKTCGGEVVCRSTKAAISMKRLKIDKKLLRRAYRNSQTLFRTVPSPTPYGLFFPKIRGSQLLLSQERVKYGLQIWPIHSQGPSEQKCVKSLKRRECGHIQGLPNFSSYPNYLRNEWRCELEIWPQHSESPSEQNPGNR